MCGRLEGSSASDVRSYAEHLRQVWWGCSMEAPVDQDTDLELDPLLDGKPVELVTDVIRD